MVLITNQTEGYSFCDQYFLAYRILYEFGKDFAFRPISIISSLPLIYTLYLFSSGTLVRLLTFNVISLFSYTFIPLTSNIFSFPQTISNCLDTHSEKTTIVARGTYIADQH